MATVRRHLVRQFLAEVLLIALVAGSIAGLFYWGVGRFVSEAEIDHTGRRTLATAVFAVSLGYLCFQRWKLLRTQLRLLATKCGAAPVTAD